MAVNVERIIERADAQLKRLERAHLLRLREVVNDAYRRLAAEIRREWPQALAEALADGMTPAFREARARALLAQLQPYMRALDLGASTSGVPNIIRDLIILGEQSGFETATELLSAFDASPLRAIQTAQLNMRAIEAAVNNSSARLTNHSAEAVRRIEQSVVDGMVAGRHSHVVAREVREILRGGQRLNAAETKALHHRAVVIAHTETANAKSEAHRQRYAEAGIGQVQWYATLDERVCPYCAWRHGQVFAREATIVPAHPLCRCYTAPFRPEWLAEGVDLVDVDYWRDSRAEIVRHQRDLRRTATAFELKQGRAAPVPLWTP